MVHDNGELCEQPKSDIVSESIWLSGSSLAMLLGLHFCFWKMKLRDPFLLVILGRTFLASGIFFMGSIIFHASPPSTSPLCYFLRAWKVIKWGVCSTGRCEVKRGLTYFILNRWLDSFQKAEDKGRSENVIHHFHSAKLQFQGVKNTYTHFFKAFVERLA